ncbi:hypothetical protein Athai_54950 [Actinocatenispora thailandica]|uniref:Uncharacterized protein n=1 Tax=Actinocatenispora thailandica TaxID=227318 RepID=A0A7R7DUC2_9ACTN|nr:hypothetical protein [Actinocatenispora thailandica]BCJ37992.1 hypothetical protein Athai_54950 [Actinocatenispora thailandica]
MTRTLLAARNNADWCRAMCRAHGLHSRTTGAVWSCPERTPPYYPDAVTLRPDVTADEVLAGVDAGPGCSVKDSFGTLDLSPAGFVPIIEATWLYRQVGTTGPGAAQTGAARAGAAQAGTAQAGTAQAGTAAAGGGAAARRAEWRRVDDADALDAWIAGWDGGAGIFRPELLADPDVAVLARYDGEAVTGGAVVNRSPGCLGVSNLYASTGDPADAWRGAVATAYAVFEPRPVVGYEHGDDLAAAVRAGCTPLTTLRIWLNPTAPR